jgi:hypothetical protein
MITTVLLNIFVAFAGTLVWVLQAFGPATLPAGIVSSMPTFASFYSTLDSIFPVSTVLIIIAAQVTIELSILTYRLFKWGYQKIPTIT